jgi:septal ring factor EnvC (AmiA/AmiB activator)
MNFILGNNSSPVTRASTIIIPPSSLNEVTSSEQSSNVKRQRTAPISTNPTVVNFRTNFPSSSSALALSPINTLTTNGSNQNPGSDDQRKRQIRDSNREAARRCRERRRQYIEQLEGNLEQHKAQIKQLTEKLSRIERENTQLRAILSETKILHPGSRLSINESHVDYANVIAATGLDFNSESNHQTDGGTIQRNYINRNNL